MKTTKIQMVVNFLPAAYLFLASLAIIIYIQLAFFGLVPGHNLLFQTLDPVVQGQSVAGNTATNIIGCLAMMGIVIGGVQMYRLRIRLDMNVAVYEAV